MPLSSYFRSSSTFSKGDEGFEASNENLHKIDANVGSHTARRKSTLQIITDDEGLHTVKLHGGAANDNWEHNRRRSSRQERWQSTRERLEDRRTSVEAQMEKVRKAARRSIMEVQHQMKNQAPNSSKPRSSTYPTVDMENDRESGLQSISFQDELEDFTSEQMKTCRGNNQKNPGNRESKPRRVSFPDEVEKDPFEDFMSEQMKSCRENNQSHKDNRKSKPRSVSFEDESEEEDPNEEQNIDEEHGNITSGDNRHSEGNIVNCCVEMEDGAVTDDDKTNGKHFFETRF